MTTKIDRFGRIVIPKRLRDDLGLGAGSEVVIEEHRQAIVVRLAQEPGGMSMEKGFLVASGKPEKPVDIVEWIKQERDRRIRTVSGLGR